MPYRRKRSYRKRLPKKGSKNINWPRVAAQAWRYGKYAMSVLNSEKKNYDVTNFATIGMSPIPNTGLVYGIFSPITQGDDNNQRDGNSIRAKSINFNISFLIHASATQTRIKWAVIQDVRPQIGTIPSFTDIYTSTGVNGLINIDNQSGRFKVLRTGMLVLSTGAYTEKMVERWIPYSYPVKYNDSGNVIQNQAYLVFVSDEITNTPTSAGTLRVRFYDN